MSLTPKDPLLSAARFMAGAAMALCVFVGGIVALVTPVLLLNQQRVLAELSSKGAAPEVMGAILIVLALVIVCAALGFLFFRHLYRMIGTVSQGDPFTPANADRLRAMGWIVVAVHVAVLPMAAMAEYVESVADKVHGNFEISIGGILLALVLFILARVFRQGAAMRTELEGTV